MAKNPYESMREEIPSLEFLVSVSERMQELPPDELTKLALFHAGAADKIVRKDLRFITEAQASSSGVVVTDVKAVRNKATFDVQTLARMLTGAGLASQVKDLRKKKLATPELGEVLVGLAKKSKDELVRGMGKNLQALLEQLAEVEERVAKGGHPALELRISKLAQQAWVHTDVATNLMLAALLKNGIPRDPIVDTISKVRSPLRPRVVGTQVPPAKTAKSNKKSAKKASETASNGATPPSEPPATPANHAK